MYDTIIIQAHKKFINLKCMLNDDRTLLIPPGETPQKLHKYGNREDCSLIISTLFSVFMKLFLMKNEHLIGLINLLLGVGIYLLLVIFALHRVAFDNISIVSDYIKCLKVISEIILR